MDIISEKQFYKLLGKIQAGKPLTEDEFSNFEEVIDSMTDLMNDADSDDAFGTEGWKHRMGWD